MRSGWAVTIREREALASGGKSVLESVDVESLTAILTGKASPPD